MPVTIAPDVVSDLAPLGLLRAAINLGNPVLAQTAPDGTPAGITVDLAREFARRADLPIMLATFDGAAKAFAAVKDGALDVAFIAIEPARATELEFTAPYALIEGTYMVREGSPLREIADFDRPGIRIAVGNGSAYHLYLQRTIKHATLVPADTGTKALDMFLADGLEAAACVRQPLDSYAATHPGLRVLAGRFMEIRQAVAVAKGRVKAIAWLAGVVEDLKASGFVADALARSGQDAAVAPPG